MFIIVISMAFMRSGLQPGQSVSGYQCYNIDAESVEVDAGGAWDGKGFPPVFKGPSEESGKFGVASGLVYVAWPLQKQNGFVQMLEVWRGRRMDLGVCDQAAISRAWDLKVAVRCRGTEMYNSVASRPGSQGMVVPRWSRHSRGQVPRAFVASAIKKPAVH